MRIVHMMALAALVVGCAGACGGSDGAAVGPGPVGGTGVRVGNILFRSNHNGSTNPAVDTVAAGSTLEWTWVSTGGISHSVRSGGAPAFTSSATMSGSGTTYAVTFPAPGVFTYDCAVHGAAMTGRVVVQ